MFLLKSDRLTVPVAEPGENPNNGSRFDRAGFVLDVILDQSTSFFGSEARNLDHKSSGGRGLCCEYKADYSGEVSEGNYYPKFGIGLLRKRGEKYRYFETYDTDPFTIETEHDGSTAEFHTLPKECLGYAMESRKKISAEGSHLTMDVKVTNTGTKEIVSGEYCHNFFCIDGMASSPDYRVDFPDLRNLPEGILPNKYKNECNFRSDRGGVSLISNTLLGSLSDLPDIEGNTASPFRWTISHKGAKAAAHVTEEIRPDKITLWSIDHIFSPEIFFTFRIAPGESFQWKRIYTFEQEGREVFP